MSTADNKWKWENQHDKKPELMKNDGTLLAEQKANSTIDDIVEEMILNGKMAELARYRNASTAKSAEEALAQATKLPNLINPMDIKEAQENLNEMNIKIQNYIDEENKYFEMLNEAKIEAKSADIFDEKA